MFTNLQPLVSRLRFLGIASWKKIFGVKLNDFTCAALKCRKAHISYIECLSERRRCVLPDVVESRSVDVYVFLPSSN